MAGLKFRVLLDSKDADEVFRDIIISDGADFESFYRSILSAYEFSNDQMASFYMSNANWDKGFEISLFDMTFGENPDQILPAVMSDSTIREYITEPNQRMILVHDFLCMWIFLIELIEVVKDTPHNPQVALSIGKSPDENSKSSEDESLRFETESETDDEDDEFGFDEFEDGYDDYDF